MTMTTLNVNVNVNVNNNMAADAAASDLGQQATTVVVEDGLAFRGHDIAKPSAVAIDEITCASSVMSSLPPVEVLSMADEDGSGSVASSVTDPMASKSGGAVSAAAAVQEKQEANDKFVQWQCGDMLYSDLIQDGLRYKARCEGSGVVRDSAIDAENVVMLFESPSTASKETSFYNSQVFPIHDYPPSDPANKTVLGPLRYSMMNGNTFPSYLRDAPPQDLLKHWNDVLPEIEAPTFVSDIKPDDRVCAYLPLEHIQKHVNDPHVHYHIAGKDALHLMTPNTPKRLANTKDVRPCIAKVTHSMASKGIFVINNDEDEQEMFDFIASSGNPSYVVTDFVDIQRNVSCHFFIHPDGTIVWFGSSENYKLPNGNWGMDAMIVMDEQEELRQLQLPYAREVADYCLSLGFWGFCGIDVLFDPQGQGHVVDVNPRTTGTCPALMAGHVLRQRHGYKAGVFRRSGKYAYPGSQRQLMDAVAAYNETNAGTCTIVLASVFECGPHKTMLNVGVYGHDLSYCRVELDKFAQRAVESEC